MRNAILITIHEAQDRITYIQEYLFKCCLLMYTVDLWPVMFMVLPWIIIQMSVGVAHRVSAHSGGFNFPVSKRSVLNSLACALDYAVILI